MRAMNYQMEKIHEADVDWQRDKDDGPLGGDVTDEEEVEVEDDALTDEERRFLEWFPSWKEKENKCIRTLYAIADSIDKSHHKATKTKVVANIASAISGVMSLIGLALTPITAGGSLVLTAAGTGLGAISGVTNIVTDAKENSRNKRALAQANRVMPSSDQNLEDVRGEKMAYVKNGSNILYKGASAYDVIRNHIRAFGISKTHPHIASAAKKLITAGQVSAQRSIQVQKAFGGTALAMTGKSLMKNGVLAALSLGQDIYAIYENWKDLEAASPTELAEELRKLAQEQEQVVSEYTYNYKRLKKRLSEKRPGKSSLKRAMK